MSKQLTQQPRARSRLVVDASDERTIRPLTIVPHQLAPSEPYHVIDEQGAHVADFEHLADAQLFIAADEMHAALSMFVPMIARALKSRRYEPPIHPIMLVRIAQALAHANGEEYCFHCGDVVHDARAIA